MTHNNSTLGRGLRNPKAARFVWRISIAATLVTLAIALSVFRTTSASTPTGATINPTATAPITWTGTGTGGGALNDPVGVLGGEDLCQEGLSCDTFTLTVGGTTADWSGKLIRVKIEWQLPVTDYDLYIHKDSNSGPLVGSSGRGATSPTEPLTWEDTTIDPAITGTGILHDSRCLLSGHRARSISRQRHNRNKTSATAATPAVNRSRTSLSQLCGAAGDG